MFSRSDKVDLFKNVFETLQLGFKKMFAIEWDITFLPTFIFGFWRDFPKRFLVTQSRTTF